MPKPFLIEDFLIAYKMLTEVNQLRNILFSIKNFENKIMKWKFSKFKFVEVLFEL